MGLEVTWKSIFHSHPCASYLPQWKTFFFPFIFQGDPKAYKTGSPRSIGVSSNELPKFTLLKSKIIRTMEALKRKVLSILRFDVSDEWESNSVTISM